MEPEDETLHPRRQGWHPHSRPSSDPGPSRARLRLHSGPRRWRRHGPVHRHQETGPGLRAVLRRALQHALRQRAVAGRDAHQLSHDRQADRQDEAIPAHARLGRVRCHAQEGGAAAGTRADQARAQPGRYPRHDGTPRSGVHPRHQEGVHRGHRGPQARRAHRRGSRHQLRSRPGGLRDSRQRRRHQVRAAHGPSDLRRRAGGTVHPFEAHGGHKHPPRRSDRGGDRRTAGPSPSGGGR